MDDPFFSVKMNSEPKPLYVEILLPLAVDRSFTYIWPFETPPQLGQCVHVYFHNRRRLGVVWECVSQTTVPNQRLQPVIAPLETYELLPPLRKFIAWSAHYTLTPIGTMLSLALSNSNRHADYADKDLLLYANPIEHMELSETERDHHSAICAKPGLSLDYWIKHQRLKAVLYTLLKKNLLQGKNRTLNSKKPEVQVRLDRLSTEQIQAFQTIKALFWERTEQNTIKPTVLQGVTGSGKTEVYFELIAEAYTKGKQCLILMPEIALTQQFLDRFAQRFGFEAILWNASLTQLARHRIRNAVFHATGSVVVGVRSALFLPFLNLGLIIVDEEHDQAFKQEERIIYNARDLAVMRAYCEEAAILLSSATPSLETYVNIQKHKYHRVELTARYSSAALPKVSVIDLNQPSNALVQNRVLSSELINAIRDTLSRNEQAMLYLNRRGYASVILCRSCGYRFVCASCSLNLTQHELWGKLLCHVCGYEESIPQVCQRCSSAEPLYRYGFGVEHVYQEVCALFPEARAVVLSSDSLKAKVQDDLLNKIIEGHYDIIIGTQVISKGHNFPHLTTIGLLNIDYGLTSPEFRAIERAFQTVQQVTGRAGRYAKQGYAYIQTHYPRHPLISAIIEQQDHAFYSREAQLREQANLPPFVRFIALVVCAKSQSLAELTANELALKAAMINEITTLGPIPAPITKIRNEYRYRLLFKAEKNTDLQSLLYRHILTKRHKKGVRLQLDVDPLSFF